MLIAVFGQPSAGTNFGVQAIQTLVEVVWGKYTWSASRVAEDVEKLLEASKTGNVILTNDLPDPRISSLLRGNGVRVIVFSDDPVESALFVRATRKTALNDAVRLICMSLASIHDFALGTFSLKVRSQSRSMTLAKTIVEIANHLNIRLEREQLIEVLKRFYDRHGPSDTLYDVSSRNVRSVAGTAELTEDEKQLVMQALGAFEPMIDGRPVDEAIWPRGMFLMTGPNTPLAGVIDLEGPARVFIHGPYLHLPTGHWRGVLAFRVSENLSKNRLDMKLFAGPEIFAGEVGLPVDGVFTWEFEFSVSEPTVPLELRLATMEGAIEGKFELLGLKVNRRRNF